MKKLLIFIFLLSIFNAVQAQEKKEHNGFMKGDKYLSGMIGYNSASNSDNSKSKKFEVSPRFGYFINDFVAVGGRLGYSQNTGKNSSGDKIIDNTAFTIEAFGRYYLLPGSRFSLFGELGVGFGSIKNINKNKTNGVNVGVTPGLSYFINQHFAVEFAIGVLSYETVKRDGASGSTDNFSVGVDLENINFGFIYKF